jgi:pimeloyl-ACP methyl ester carboxylesterase
MERQTIQANGLTLAASVWGNPTGPPLVLLHGIGSRAESWLPVADGLGARFRVIALDLRGHGMSTHPESGYLLPDYASDLGAAIDAFELERPLLLGHSLGSLVALTFAAENPGRLGRIVAEDPPLRTRPDVLPAFDGWQRLNAAPIPEVAAWFAGEHPTWTSEECRRRAEAICGTHPAVFAELRAEAESNLASGRVERLDTLSTIATPILVVRGDPALGSMTTPDDARRLAATVPNALVVVTPEAGHNIHRAQPDRFLSAVAPFLAG